MNTRIIDYLPHLNSSNLLIIISFLLTVSCTNSQMNNMKDAQSNKQFIYEMISQKKKLEDYPGRASDSMVVYEPSSLPFGGVYKGYDAYQQFYPKVRDFYDFSRFELLNVYADSDAVFAIIKAGIAKSNDSILLCEHFTFNKEGQIIEVRLFIHDFAGRPVHLLLNSSNQK